MAKFLKSLGLLEAMREAIRSSGGATGGMKRTSGSTEWGRTKKKGKTSSGNLRRSATKASRQAGRKQAQQYEEGSSDRARAGWEKERTYKGVRSHPPKQGNKGKTRPAGKNEADSPRTYTGVQKRQGRQPNTTGFPLKLSAKQLKALKDKSAKQANLKEGTIL